MRTSNGLITVLWIALFFIVGLGISALWVDIGFKSIKPSKPKLQRCDVMIYDKNGRKVA